MDDLFYWMNNLKHTVNPLILSSVFHYEFVFIHPFSDGNGRTARLWQTAILSHWKEFFKYIPIESIIRKHQEGYYTAIQNCNNVGNSTEFIEFMLKIIDEAVDKMILSQRETTQETYAVLYATNNKQKNDKINDKINDKETQILKALNENSKLTIPELNKITKISTATISRYLKQLQDNKIIERIGSNKSGYWKIL